MSIEAKAMLMEEVKRKLEDKLTMLDLNNFLSSLSNELTNYEVEIIKRDGTGDEKDDIFQLYIDSIRIEGKSEKTLRQYETIIKKFLNFVCVPTQKISVFNVRSYFANEKMRGVSDVTLDWVRSILNAYFGWLCREGIITMNPMGNIGAIKSKKKVMEIFSDVDIELMKTNCKNDRDVALISFLATTGCRVDEVHRLNRSDVNFDTLEVKVLGKGNKERIVYINSVVVMQLKKYFDSRKDDDPCLFRSKYGRITVNGIESILRDLGERSGVKHVHPHKFRRTLATNLIKKGMPIEKVAAILGHEKIDTTMMYVVLDNSDIKHSYQRYA